jgi:hypothetical protein
MIYLGLRKFRSKDMTLPILIRTFCFKKSLQCQRTYVLVKKCLNVMKKKLCGGKTFRKVGRKTLLRISNTAWAMRPLPPS